MERKRSLVGIVLISFLLFGCEDSALLEPQPPNDAILTKAAYDSGYVEWDNVDHLTYKLGSDVVKDDLSIPWEPGSANAVGIPKDWVDDNLRNADSGKRAYSKANGWELVYCNLLDKAQRNKYFALYNKNLGVLRVFFYSFEASSGYGTSSTFIGLAVTGSSSLLNFSFDYPLPMDQRQTAPTTFFTPSGMLWGDQAQGVGYKANTWYAMEVECAYEASSQSANRLMFRLWAATITKSQSTGSSTGTINGNIVTTYSNNPNFSLTINADKTSNVQVSYNTAKDELGSKIEAGVNKGDSFFKGIWSNLKKDVPSIVSKGIKEGLSAIFSSGGSFITKAVGKLANAIFGGGTTPMQATSKVDLGIQSTLKVSTESTQTVVGWGDINPIPLPGSGQPTSLFNEKLGVWNLANIPVVYVDMNTTAYFYPPELVPNPERPRAYELGFSYTLIPATLSINPAVLSRFTVQNAKHELVYSSTVYNVQAPSEPYGLISDKRLYKSYDTSFRLVNPLEDFHGGEYNPDTSFERDWYWGLTYFNTKLILCRVSFDLVPKNGGKTYSFSKYFVVNGVKRNHYHKEATITQGMYETNALFSNDEFKGRMQSYFNRLTH